MLLTSVLRPPYVWLRDTIADFIFERRLGVRTSGVIALDELGIAAVDREQYKPVGWLMLRRILPPNTVTVDDVFLDIGCGMGRAMLVAGRYPFRRLVGVELSTRLLDIARDNLAHSRARLRCKNIVLVNADAVTYEISDDVSVVFLFNPFRGAIFAIVIKNVLDSYNRKPRMLRLVYVNPVEEPALMSTGRFRMVRHVRGFRPGLEWSRSNSAKLYAVQPPARI